MFLANTSFRITSSVSAILIAAFVGTGFISSAYQRHKTALGEQHYAFGRQLQTRGELFPAIEEYRQALLFSPDNGEYRISFAAALIDSGHLDEAESHLEQMLEDDPTNGVLNLMRARIALRRKRIPNAIDYYQRAVYEYWPPDRAGDRREARWELIDLLEKFGRREQAIGELMTLYANASSDPASRTKVGFALLQNGASSEAMQVFRAETLERPRDPETHRGLGQAFFASGQYVSARHEFERALRLHPGEQQATTALALTNSVIDMDPDLPGLSGAERLRRSQNLLRKVIGFVRKCSESGTAKDRTSDAEKLITSAQRKSSDLALTLQNAAQQLWDDYAATCSRKGATDIALATVFGGISHD